MQTQVGNATGLKQIIPPDTGFIIAMVVCIGIIFILFIIFALLFCCKQE